MTRLTSIRRAVAVLMLVVALVVLIGFDNWFLDTFDQWWVIPALLAYGGVMLWWLPVWGGTKRAEHQE